MAVDPLSRTSTPTSAATTIAGSDNHSYDHVSRDMDPTQHGRIGSIACSRCDTIDGDLAKGDLTDRASILVFDTNAAVAVFEDINVSEDW